MKRTMQLLLASVMAFTAPIASAKDEDGQRDSRSSSLQRIEAPLGSFL